jgi:CTP:molybdopterin cytidylyltransferase MocA
VIVGAGRDAVEAAVRDLDVACVGNDAWQGGIASSLHAAVAWARDERADGLVVVLADQPLLSRAHVDALVAAVRAGAPAAASVYGDIVGVPAAFAASQWGALAALRGDAGAAKLLGELPGVARVAWPDGRVDVDVEHDVATLHEIEATEASAR